MKESTLKITTGAMFIAIFGVLLLLNRQTGGLFEEGLLYFLPIPMVAYAAKYGWKAGVPVFIAMCLTTIFCSTPTAIFYAGTEAFLGLVFGGCIYRKMDMTKTMLIVMVLSAIFNVLNTIVLAGIFGNDLSVQIDSMREMMVEALNQATALYPEGTKLPDFSAMLTTSFLTRMMIISMIIFGLVQGFLIYQISLLILRRLRFNFPRPKSIYEMNPPRWTGYLALAGFFLYYATAMKSPNEQILVIAQTVGMCGYLYLAIFGCLALILILRGWISSRIPRVLLAMLVFMAFGQLCMVLGFLYIGLDYHTRWMNYAIEAAKKNGPANPTVRTDYSGSNTSNAGQNGGRIPYGSTNTQNSSAGKPSISAIARRRLDDDKE